MIFSILGQRRAFDIPPTQSKASRIWVTRGLFRSLTVAAAFSLAACVTRKAEPELRFDMSGITKEEQTKAEKGCELEAEKAIIPIKIGIIAAEQWRKIYTLCLEAKGAKLIRPMTTPLFFKTAGLSDER